MVDDDTQLGLCGTGEVKEGGRTRHFILVDFCTVFNALHILSFASWKLLEILFLNIFRLQLDLRGSQRADYTIFF